MKNQKEFNLFCGNIGGRRPGAGRPRKHSTGVAHIKREKVTRHYPIHINFKYNAQIRSDETMKVLRRSFQHAYMKGLNVTHFTLQSNHIHLIAETNHNKALNSGMRSITATLNHNFKKGKIQTERYHLHVLKTPTEVRNAIQYVLNNDLKHGLARLEKYTGKHLEGKSWLLTSYKK